MLKNFILSIFHAIHEVCADPDGSWSSKRISAFICLGCSIAFAFIGALGTKDTMPYVAIFMGAALSFHGISAAQDTSLVGKGYGGFLSSDGPK